MKTVAHPVRKQTIDHNTFVELVQARAVSGARAVGQPGGWGVVVLHDTNERPLAATRSREVRVFKKLETLVGYLSGIGIHGFHVDTSNFDPQNVGTYSRPDASVALKRAHAAAAHDKWFREQVARGLAEADNPATKWISNEAVKGESAQRRAAWRKAAPGQNAIGRIDS